MGKVKHHPDFPCDTHKEKTAFLRSIKSKIVKFVRDHGKKAAMGHWGIGLPRLNEILDYYRRSVGSPNMVIKKHKKSKSKKNNNTGATA